MDAVSLRMWDMGAVEPVVAAESAKAGIDGQ